jgi:hypothetical protein
MVLITVVAAGILISKRICRMRRTAAQERLEEAEKAIQAVWDETIEPDWKYWKVEMRGCRNRQHLQKKIPRE